MPSNVSLLYCGKFYCLAKKSHLVIYGTHLTFSFKDLTEDEVHLLDKIQRRKEKLIEEIRVSFMSERFFILKIVALLLRLFF